MNTTKHSTRPTVTAAHAEDAGVAAYLTARKLGANPAAAMRAHANAYAAALQG